MTVHYRPAASGGWIALCAGSRAVIIGGAPDDSLLSRLSAALVEDDGFSSTVNELVREGLAAMPPFALVDLSAVAARVIVRGGVTVTVSGPSGIESINGAGVSTWTERAILGASALAVEVTAAVVAETAGTLIVESGAVWVAGLDVGTAAAPRADPVERPVVIDTEATVTDLPKVEVEQARPAGYDYLFGDTVYRDVADAAVEQPNAEPNGDTVAEPEAGDHDGQTILTSDIAKLRPLRKAKRALAAVVVQGPSIVLTLSGGSTEALTQPILVGRAPSIGKLTDAVVPRLLTIGTADQDISRTHARIALEGGTVVVTDLHSRNGTIVVLPGKAPQKLRAGEPTSIIVGTVIDFGGGVELTVSEGVESS